MSLTTRQRLSIFLALALAMMATRVNHFAALPDASWAVFFLGGFYLRTMSRWAFPLLIILAGALDYYVISGTGISFWNHYCVSAAYWFLVPAYFSLWLGGLWLSRHYDGLSVRSLGVLTVSFLATVSVCFLLSNGSFYWLSTGVQNPSMAGWVKNLSDWYLPYLYTASLYTSAATVVHVLAAQIARHWPVRTTQAITR